MKNIGVAVLVAFSIMMSGCSSKQLGEPKANYEPKYINKLSEDNLAYIKVAKELGIWRVDRNREANFINVMLSGGLDSIKVKEGKHTLSLSFKGKDIHIGQVYYKKGHEYFVDYVFEGKRIYYWVKDINTNDVVYGKEIKDDENDS